jgi:hypothetical protein
MTRATLCALLLILPSGLGAQHLQITPYVAQDLALAGAPTLVGLALAGYSGPVGLRLSAAMDAPSSPIAPVFGRDRADAIGAWSADADMVLSGARLGIAVAGLEPSLFAGFGAHGIRRFDGSRATVPAWSYGAGLALPVTGWLSLDGEARYRMPHESRDDRLPPEVSGGWEMRAGLSLRLGGGRPARSPVPRTPSPSGRRGTVGATATAALTLNTADRYVGTPYVWGGETPDEGFDCSGFVRYVFARNNVWLPRVSRDQARAGERVQPIRANLREGDLLFFAGNDGVIDHVAIYAGGGRIIHSSASGGGVAYDRLDSGRGRWYRDHMVAVRRVIR